VANDNDENGTMWTLPFDLILEVAASCAAAFNLKTYFNLALCCKAVHESLEHIILVWSGPYEDLPCKDLKCCMDGDVARYLLNNENELPEEASVWSKVQ
jgi:hypothetical protein